MKVYAMFWLPETNNAVQCKTYCGWHPVEFVTPQIGEVTCKTCLYTMKHSITKGIETSNKNLKYITDQIKTLE